MRALPGGRAEAEATGGWWGVVCSAVAFVGRSSSVTLGGTCRSCGRTCLPLGAVLCARLCSRKLFGDGLHTGTSLPGLDHVFFTI